MPTPHDLPRGADAASAAQDDVPAINPILDTAGAVERVLGNGALYLRMVRRFHQDQLDAGGASPIRTALASGDLALAHRLAHTLKGTAGMLGAGNLHARAVLLEKILRDQGGEAAMGELALLEQAMAELMVVVRRLLEGEPLAGRAPTPTPPPLRANNGAGTTLLLRQLAHLLDTGDGAALDLLEQSGPALKSAMGATGFSEVMFAANAFDFEAALAALQRAVPFDLDR